MKLIHIIMFEDSTSDDVFSAHELPTEGARLIKILRRRSQSNQHQAFAIEHNQSRLSKKLTGIIYKWNYPGGVDKLDADLKNGTIISFGTRVADNTPNNVQLISQLELLSTKSAARYSTANEIEKQIKRIKKAEAAKGLAAKQEGAAQKQIPVSQIPEKVVVGKRSFANPYFYGDDARYAGHPAHFPWTSQMAVYYNELEDILTANGLDGFTTMYASTARARNGANLYNFALIGANGKFVWRKYDPGGGAGLNDVYCLNDKLHTTTFCQLEEHDPAKFADLIKEIT